MLICSSLSTLHRRARRQHSTTHSWKPLVTPILALLGGSCSVWTYVGIVSMENSYWKTTSKTTKLQLVEHRDMSLSPEEADSAKSHTTLLCLYICCLSHFAFHPVYTLSTFPCVTPAHPAAVTTKSPSTFSQLRHHTISI